MALVGMILLLILSVGFWVAKKSEVNRWGALLMFSGSLGLLSVLFYDPIIPYVLLRWGNKSQLFFLTRIAHASVSCMSSYLPPYFYMGFCLTYSGFLKPFSKYKKAVLCMLFIPSACFFILYPPVLYYFPPYKAMLFWIIIYEISGYLVRKNAKKCSKSFHRQNVKSLT